jgi:hypothetical protein
MMAGHSRWKTLQARRLAETGDAGEHPEYEQAGRDLRLGDQLRAIRRSRNLTQAGFDHEQLVQQGVKAADEPVTDDQFGKR